MTSEEVLAAAQRFVDFVNTSPTPYHAVRNVADTLVRSGYRKLDERASWMREIVPGGRYFFTRNQSTVVAFSVGKGFVPGNGVLICGTHTDSPNLRLKLNSSVTKQGMRMLSLEPYGGLLAHTWFDRDLGIAGRLVVRRGESTEKHLVHIAEPLVRIPNLAIHLNRSVNSDGFKFGMEEHLTGMLGSAEFERPLPSDSPVPVPGLPIALTERLAIEAGGVAPADILACDLQLFDVQPATIGGIHREFVFAPRIDNLLSSFCAMEALMAADAAAAETSPESDNVVRMAAMFDHEEVGSTSAHGADSALLPDSLRRILSDLAAAASETAVEESVSRSLSRSILVSVDCAHACHPNYGEKHHELHRPKMQRGVVLKYNSNQRYATNDVGVAAIKLCAEAADVPLQEFMVRNDSPCGSTIGPLLSSKLGIRTVDIGAPQLSMHSIRETCGILDVSYLIALLTSFWSKFSSVDASLSAE